VLAVDMRAELAWSSSGSACHGSTAIKSSSSGSSCTSPGLLSAVIAAAAAAAVFCAACEAELQHGSSALIENVSCSVRTSVLAVVVHVSPSCRSDLHWF